MKDTLGGLGISEEQIDLKNVATAFCQEKSPVDAVRRLMEEGGGEDPAVWSEIVELGWLGIAIPEAYDGVGLGLAEVVPVVEQMGRNLMSGPFVPTTLVSQLILAAGTAGNTFAGNKLRCATRSLGFFCSSIRMSWYSYTDKRSFPTIVSINSRATS